MKNWLLAALVFSACPVHADSLCDKPRDDFDGLYCLNKIYQEADKELNEDYQKLSAKLDASGKKALKSGQLLWIETRNEQCSKHEQGEFFVNLKCATNSTVERLRFLQDRLRECVSTGCQNSQL
jgi:uncharacterized protein YecT (DUF1311 family)